MSSDVQHTDIGAYVLGLLEPEDRWRVETHVAHCPRCRAELPELSWTAATLRAVPPDLAVSMLDPDPVGATAAEPPPHVFDLVRRQATTDHRRRRRRDVLLAAAVGVVVLAGGVAVGARVLDDGHPSDSSAESAVEDDGDDDGGLDATVPGASAPVVLEGTDPDTGAVGTITMEAAGWGTSVGLRLANVHGPLECELVAVTTSGERVVSSWSVPESGYGVAGAPEPLTVEGSVASTPDEITRFDVRTSDDQTLLSIPT
jgi:Putative zinc-finger